MVDLHRRSAIAGGLTLLAGGAIDSLGTDDERDGVGNDAEPGRIGTETRTSVDDEGSPNSDEDGATANEGDGDAAESDDEVDEPDADSGTASLDLSVAAPESVPAPEGRADFLITATNCGEDAVSTPLVLEIAHVEDELETLALAPGESTDAVASYAGSHLGPGEHDWTVTSGLTDAAGAITVDGENGNGAS